MILAHVTLMVLIIVFGYVYQWLGTMAAQPVWNRPRVMMLGHFSALLMFMPFFVWGFALVASYLWLGYFWAYLAGVIACWIIFSKPLQRDDLV